MKEEKKLLIAAVSAQRLIGPLYVESSLKPAQCHGKRDKKNKVKKDWQL